LHSRDRRWRKRLNVVREAAEEEEAEEEEGRLRRN
jgi:hypothetical protein